MGLRLELFVQDMDASVDFYRRALGFDLLRRDPAYASLRSDTATIGLGPASGQAAEETRGLGVETVLEVDGVQAYEERVRASGYRVSEPLSDRPWGLTDFRVYDPDGYYLRITSKS